MVAWATKAQARAHWPDAASLPDATLDVLLEVATAQCAAYAPPVVLNGAAATVRTNLPVNPIGSKVNTTTALVASGVSATLGDGYVRGTLTTATATNIAQFIATPYTVGGGANAIPITPGLHYTVHAQGRTSVPGAGMGVLVTQYDAAFAAVSGGSVASAATPVNATDFTDLVGYTTYALPTAAFVSVRVGIAGTTPRNIGDTIDVRRIYVEAARLPGAWFDGDTVDTPGTDYAWTGTPGLSPSTATTTPALVPTNYMLATVYQAREAYAAGQRDGDVIGLGDYAIRVRPLTASVKALLRPPLGQPVTG